MRTAVLALSIALAFPAAPAFAAKAKAPAQGQAATGALQGVAQSSTGQTLANFTVQLREVVNGQLVGSTTSNAAGAFSFTGLNPASYITEVVNSAGQIVGASAVATVTAGATVTLTVTASAAAALTAGAAGGAAAAAAGGAGAATGVSTAVVVTTIAAAAGVAGVVVPGSQSEASPTR